MINTFNVPTTGSPAFVAIIRAFRSSRMTG